MTNAMIFSTTSWPSRYLRSLKRGARACLQSYRSLFLLNVFTGTLALICPVTPAITKPSRVLIFLWPALSGHSDEYLLAYHLQKERNFFFARSQKTWIRLSHLVTWDSMPITMPPLMREVIRSSKPSDPIPSWAGIPSMARIICLPLSIRIKNIEEEVNSTCFTSKFLDVTIRTSMFHSY